MLDTPSLGNGTAERERERGRRDLSVDVARPHAMDRSEWRLIVNG